MADAFPWGWLALAAVFGIAVGAGELISRYRDEPFRALQTMPSVWYLALNAGVGAGAFWLLHRYPTIINAEALANQQPSDSFLIAIWAGVGGMFVLRSKLFVIKGEDGQSYPFGPDIVVDRFLKVLDREVDRKRAIARQKAIIDALEGIENFTELKSFLEAALLSMQGLTDAEKAEITAAVEQYKDLDWPDSLKQFAIGFAYQAVMGEKGFRDSLASFRNLTNSGANHES